MAVAETAELVTRLSLKDGLSKGVLAAQRNLSTFDKATGNTQAALGRFRTNVTRAGQAVGLGLAGAAVASVKWAADFESQLNTINTVARQSPEALGGIGESVRAIARTTGTPLEELTQGYYDLVSAGVQAGDATNVLTAANRLAIGGLATTAETVDLLTTAINAYGGDATRAGTYADVFAKAIERGKVTAADLAGSFAQVGPLAASNGIEIGELAAAYAKFTATGFDAGQVSTFMASAIIALTRRTGDLEKLEKATGKSYLAIAGKKGLAAAMEELRNDAKKTGKPLIDFLGRQEALQFAIGTTGDEFVKYNRELAAVGESAGTASGQADKRLQGLNFQLGVLQANVRDAGITLGSALLPEITPIVGKLGAFLAANQGQLRTFGTDLAGAAREAGAFAARIPWDQIGTGLQTGAVWAGKLIDVFTKMPPEVQTTLIALAGLNKLTGGVPAAIFKDVAGFGLSKLTTIRAVNVNVIGKSVVGGGLGGPVSGPAGAAGGGLAGIFRNALKFTGVLAPGVILAELLAEHARQNNIPLRNIREEGFRQAQANIAQAGPPGSSLVGLTAATIQAIRAPLTAIALAEQRQGERTGGLTDAIRAQNTATYAAIEAARLRPPPVVNVHPPAITFNVSTRDIQIAQQSRNRYGRAVQ